jgi:ribosomal protein S18 acetylase RimI-like enzyme
MPNDSFSSILARGKQAWRKYGPAATLKRALYQLAQRLLNLQVYEVAWLNIEDVRDCLGEASEFCFRFLTADEVRRFAEDPSHHLTPAMADRIAAVGNLCFAALSGTRLASFSWYAFGSIEPEHSAGVRFSFPPDVAYMYHAFTHPDFRGRHLHGHCMTRALCALQPRGIRKLAGLVHWTNDASLRSCVRLGYQRLGCLITLGRGRRRLALLPRAARQCGLAVRP